MEKRSTELPKIPFIALFFKDISSLKYIKNLVYIENYIII